jgi:transposase-like protein
MDRLFWSAELPPVAGRRLHSAEFKAEMVAACRRPGVSSAAVALAHSINANLLRRWVSEAERAEGMAAKPPEPATSGRRRLSCCRQQRGRPLATDPLSLPWKSDYAQENLRIGE